MYTVLTIVPSKLRNDRFFRRFVSDSFVNYEGHICVPRDHNLLQAACEKLQVSVWQLNEFQILFSNQMRSFEF
jgi:hypothetical protein